MVKDKDIKLKSIISIDFNNWKEILKNDSVEFIKVKSKDFTMEYLETIVNRPALKRLFIVYNGHSSNDSNSTFPKPFDFTHEDLFQHLAIKKYDFLCIGYDSCNEQFNDDTIIAKNNTPTIEKAPIDQTLDLWNFNGTIQFCSSKESLSWASLETGSHYTHALTSNLVQQKKLEFSAKDCWETAFKNVAQQHKTSHSVITPSDENIKIEESKQDTDSNV